MNRRHPRLVPHVRFGPSPHLRPPVNWSGSLRARFCRLRLGTLDPGVPWIGNWLVSY